MTDEIKIWEVDDSSKAAEPVQPTDQMETERSLEDVLVKNPHMMMPGLTLVGRQTPTDSGSLDLLGVDEDGRLVVFELKRGKLTREAVAQAIDYCSYLESLTQPQLATYIADHSGKNEVENIDDFEAWYGERQEGKELISLRPTRIALIGLGADARAQRMVEFLVERGVDISLVTFHGYQCGDRMLLARQMEGGEARDAGLRLRQSDKERRRTHAEWARELDIGDLWQDAVKALSVASNGHATRSGISFYLPTITLPDNVNVSGSHSVVIDQRGMIRVTYYPGAVDVCWEEFQEKKETIPFELENPPNAPTTKKVSEQWYCLLNTEAWKIHKEALTALANDVHNAWLKKRGEAAV